MYKTRGFNIDAYHEYKEFTINDLRDHTRPASLNICEKGLKIAIIERSIQTINQGSCCTTHYVPYKRYTILMNISLVECIIHSSNYFLQKCSIRKRLGAQNKLLGKPNPDFNMKFFGSYAIVYAGTRNTLKRRSITGISLRESN